MEKKNSSHFLLGLVVGGALVYLLSQEKGRKILKQVSEEGFSALEQYLQEEVIEKAEAPHNVQNEVPVEEGVVEEPQPQPQHHSRSRRRFFRGARR